MVTGMVCRRLRPAVAGARRSLQPVLLPIVRIGTDARILFGAVLVAEDGVIRAGDRTVVMENAPREVAGYLAARGIHAWNGDNYVWELTESPGIRD
jgi:hypothetical protein